MENLRKKLRDKKKNGQLVWSLARDDFRSKYASSQLGMFWAFFRPIVMAVVYIFVFSYIARATPVNGQYPYSMWLLPGLIVWFVFSDSLMNGVTTLTQYSFLVKNIRFNISILPMVKVVSGFFIHVFFIVVIFILYLILQLPIHWQILQLIYYCGATFMFTLALTRILCTVQPFFKDMMIAIEIVLMVGIWACPVLWNLEMIPESIWWVFKLNPVFYLVNGYRDSFMGGPWFWEHWIQTVGFWLVTILLEVLGKKFFRRMSPHFADMI